MSEADGSDRDEIVASGEFGLVGLGEVFSNGCLEPACFEIGDRFLGGKSRFCAGFDLNEDESVGICCGVKGDDINFSGGGAMTPCDDGVSE